MRKWDEIEIEKPILKLNRDLTQKADCAILLLYTLFASNLRHKTYENLTVQFRDIFEKFHFEHVLDTGLYPILT